MFLIRELPVIPLAVGLSSLIEGLEVEHVETPVERRADTGLEEGLGIFRAGFGGVEIIST